MEKTDKTIENRIPKTAGRVLKGEVVSAKMKDTVVVKVSNYVKHPKYGKFLRKDRRYKAHDQGNTCAPGDKVLIKETRPISKDKHFIVIEKLASKNVEAEAQA